MIFLFLIHNPIQSCNTVIDVAASIAEFEKTSLGLGIGRLILLMIFILYQLSKESGAGRYSTFVIFLAPGRGIFGFAAKSVTRLLIDV